MRILGVGDIYISIAEIYMRPIAGGVRLVKDRMAAQAMMRMKDYPRLESILKLENMIKAGISALRQGLGLELHVLLSSQYEDSVLYGDKCEPLVLSENDQKQAMIRVMFQAMEAMHDTWVQEHQAKFEDKSSLYMMELTMDDNYRRLFVPLVLLGWRIASRYYQMTLELLGKGVLLDEIVMEAYYEQQTAALCKKHGIVSVDTLQQKLTEGADFYAALGGVAAETLARLQNSRRVAEAIFREGIVK